MGRGGAGRGGVRLGGVRWGRSRWARSVRLPAKASVLNHCTDAVASEDPSASERMKNLRRHARERPRIANTTLSSPPAFLVTSCGSGLMLPERFTNQPCIMIGRSIRQGFFALDGWMLGWCLSVTLLAYQYHMVVFRSSKIHYTYRQNSRNLNFVHSP